MPLFRCKADRHVITRASGRQITTSIWPESGRLGTYNFVPGGLTATIGMPRGNSDINLGRASVDYLKDDANRFPYEVLALFRIETALKLTPGGKRRKQRKHDRYDCEKNSGGDRHPVPSITLEAFVKPCQAATLPLAPRQRKRDQGSRCQWPAPRRGVGVTGARGGRAASGQNGRFLRWEGSFAPATVCARLGGGHGILATDVRDSARCRGLARKGGPVSSPVVTLHGTWSHVERRRSDAAGKT